MVRRRQAIPLFVISTQSQRLKLDIEGIRSVRLRVRLPVPVSATGFRLAYDNLEQFRIHSCTFDLSTMTIHFLDVK